MNRAVFLDRDGTINEEVGYLSDPGQVTLIPGAAEALVRLRDAGFKLVVVTNQSGIARGLFSEGDLDKVNGALAGMLAELGAAVDAYYYCPHHPEHGMRVNCGCRKPKPGMAFKAATDLGLDVARSYFVGDKCTDVELGRNAGGRTVLVLTGFGREEKDILAAKGVQPDKVAPSIVEAVEWILEDSR